jgi:hypothetical protein
MTFCFNRKGAQIALLCGLLAGCSQSPYVPPAFHPQQVACADHSTQQMREQLDSLGRNPDGDLYIVRHIDHILPTTRELADAGNSHGMFVYGDMEYEYQYLLHQDDVKKNDVFPDSTRTSLIDALTYVSLAAMTDSPDKLSAEKLRKEIERHIPTDWMDEARSNARQWKDHCQHK